MFGILTSTAPVFIIALGVGLLLLFLALIFDGFLDAVFFDGVLPVVSSGAVTFGIVGTLLNYKLSLSVSLIIATVSAIVSSILSYKMHEKIKEKLDDILPTFKSEDLLDIEGKILWWHKESSLGEIIVVANGQIMKMTATSKDSNQDDFVTDATVKVFDIAKDGKLIVTLSNDKTEETLTNEKSELLDQLSAYELLKRINDSNKEESSNEPV